MTTRSVFSFVLALAALVGDEASRVRFAAIKALGYYAAWNDDSAQAALCTLASTVPEKKGRNARERVLAIVGLAGSKTGEGEIARPAMRGASNSALPVPWISR